MRNHRRDIDALALAVPLLALAVLAWPSFAIAQMELRSWGPRIGYRFGDDGLDQFLLGAHADLGDVFTYTRFAPHVEVGWGDDVTTVSMSPELHYVWRDDPLGETTYFYGGGGIGLHIVDYDVDTGGGADVDDSDTDWKINIAAGVETTTSKTIGYFGEIRVSFIDGTWVEFVGGLNLLR
jgi:hypothetical protein